MSAPRKPFTSFKWRWLSVQPSEGLLRGPVFLGVLRALQKHEGQPFSSQGLHFDLMRVRSETRTDIDLARTPERNLFRNSGQYWRGTGLLEPISGEIRLTPLGRMLALGRLTNDEFAALMISNTTLPNPLTYAPAELQKWRSIGLRIKPFELILQVINELGRQNSISSAYLTPNELIRLVIPLSGQRETAEVISRYITAHRTGVLDISDWPDCAPKGNDKRLAREFLLFLENFGVLNAVVNGDHYQQQFRLTQLFDSAIEASGDVSFFEDATRTEEAVNSSRNSEIPVLIERQRVETSVLRRTNQSRFRREVLSAGNSTCILTQETTLDVLEAAHIVPVGEGGQDIAANGLCMRVDVHRLFDGGKIRLKADGSVILSEAIEGALSYQHLPKAIGFPSAVNVQNVDWREKYR